jgi:hypothetical protein
MAQAKTRSLIDSLEPSVGQFILSGIAGARHDADCHLWDVIVASDGLSFPVAERKPAGSSRATSKPIPQSLGVQEFVEQMPKWEGRLITRMKQLLGVAAISAPDLVKPSMRHVTAKNRILKREILESFRQQWGPIIQGDRQFLAAKCCSGVDLHKDPDHFEKLTGWDKKLWVTEMEFAGVAEECQLRDVPLLMLRAISDVVGYTKTPASTRFATYVAGAALRSLFEHDSFWSWADHVQHSRSRRAHRVIAVSRGARDGNDALERIERHIDDSSYQATAAEADGQRVAEAVKGGYLAQDDVALRIESISNVCIACGKGLERSRPLRPLIQAVAATIPLEEDHQITVLVNGIKQALIAGNNKGARELLARAKESRVRTFLESLPPDRLRRFLQTKIQVEGFESDAAHALQQLVSFEFTKGSLEAAEVARCLACKAVSAQYEAAAEMIELATSYIAGVVDESKRKSLLRDLKVIELFNNFLRSTENPWGNANCDPKFKVGVDSIRRLVDRRHPMQDAEAALLAWVAFQASGDRNELLTAGLRVGRLHSRGQAAHCLFNLLDLKNAVEREAMRDSPHSEL